MAQQLPPGTPGIREQLRLAALRSYAILDTPREQAYDDVAEAIHRRFSSAVALVSFVDGERQWFKACVGGDFATVDRQHAFCSFVVEHRAPMTILDARRDHRFATNPFVTGDAGLRFYAGAPLVTALGRCIGTVAAIDNRPRSGWSERDALDLSTFAVEVMRMLEVRRANLVRARALSQHLPPDRSPPWWNCGPKPA